MPSLKRTIWHWWYQLIAKKYPLPNWKFMNYGYAELNGQNLDLQGESEVRSAKFFDSSLNQGLLGTIL